MIKRPINFMGTAKFWIGVSVVVTLIGLISMLTRGINVGIDYTGGTQLELQFENTALAVPQVRDAVADVTGKSPTVKATLVKGDGGGSAFLIQTVRMNVDEREDLYTKLEAQLGKFEKLSIAEISGTIRSELILNAVLAVAIAAILQVVYITIRFEYRFAVSAIVAMLHDTLMTLGLVSLLGVEVGPPFMAAVLTVIGYSINDTIVVYDRIRENLKRQAKGEALFDLVNRSVTETLARTLFTGTSTIVAVISILAFGGETTRDFALALLIGMISGTYSSIFVASPLWLWWRNYDAGRKRRKPAIAR